MKWLFYLGCSSILWLGMTGCDATIGMGAGVRRAPAVVSPAPMQRGWRGQYPDTRARSSCPHPALAIMAMYGQDFQPGQPRRFVRPYVVNLFALELVEYPAVRPLIRAYIQWYLYNLNVLDVHGLSGTMYDLYVTPDGSEEWLESYDSADSYGATLISLIARYVRFTGDRPLVDQHRDALETIAYMLYSLLDEDGLSWVWPNHPWKYLMDNCEVYMGVRDYVVLRNTLWQDAQSRYVQLTDRLRRGIVQHLFNPISLNFHFGIDRYGTKHGSHWGTFYPDALAQIYPVAWEVLDPDTDLAKHQWEQFNCHLGPEDLESEEQWVVVRMAQRRLRDAGYDTEANLHHRCRIGIPGNQRGAQD